MARTFVGQLILRLQAQGLGEAKRVENAVSRINRAAQNLSTAHWGANFQRQLDKLSPTTRQIDQVRRSWVALHNTMNDKKLTGPARQAAIAQWSNATISHFAAMKTNADAAEKSIRNLHRVLGRAVGKPLMVMGGGYTFAYMGGVMMREGFTAASEERRQQAEAKFSGLPEAERAQIQSRSEELAEQYRLPVAALMEVMREASLAMVNTDSALAVSDEMARALLVWSNALGSQEAAIAGLRVFNKALDNIEMITPEEYKYAIEQFTKAQQIGGADVTPDDIAQAIKFSRLSGKVFSAEFLFQWLPQLIAEAGGKESGTKLRAAFDQLIVGRSSKKARDMQKKYGLLDGDGVLVDEAGFVANPITWIYDTLLPALEKHGVSKDNEVELGRIIGQLTNNRMSGDLLASVILSFEQYRRNVQEKLPRAMGLDAADEVQALNPFAAWQGFKDSLSNLSAAVLPMESVSSGLNSLADTINSFRKAVKEGDPRVVNTAMGAGALAAAWGTWKITSGIWGLITAGAALNTAAVSLQAAAVSLGAGGGVDAVGGDGKTKRSPGFWGMLLTASPWIAALLSAGDTPYNSYRNASEEERARMRQEARDAAEAYNLKRYGSPSGADDEARNKQAETDRERSLDDFLAGPQKPLPSEADIYRRAVEQLPPVSAEAPERAEPVAPNVPVGLTPAPPSIPRREAEDASMRALRMSVESGEMEAVLEEMKALAANAGQSVTESLSVSARPNVDTGAVDTLIQRLRTAIDLFRTLGATAASAQSDADAELRRTFSDYGVAP